MTDEPILSLDDLQRICDHLYRRTGMIFGENKRYYIERRVADRMEAAGAATPTAYLAILRNNAPESQALVNSFTVNETYFYREEHQLRCLSGDILPELIRGRAAGDKIRIWSNPCSTGEEAYSIAIWLLEHWRLVDAYNVEILGSDIDTRALSLAMEGGYGERALSRLPEPVVAEYFEPVRHRRRHIIRDLRDSVTFTTTNLIDPVAMRSQGVFDVIFCRNVLIYFDDTARIAAVRHLYDALAPGGFLCLGHTETLSRMNEGFVMRRFTDAIVYQRPGGSAVG